MARSGRTAPRLHRLPHRRDYTLIPAPLDLSLPEVAEKSPLPVLVVTPSSPTSTQDFSIAFMAPPPKPTVRERLTTCTKTAPIPKARSLVIIFLIMFILICHVVTHRLAMRRPHLQFAVQDGDAHIVQGTFESWFRLRLDIR
ncbi:hypothetical protein BDQ17DRAFT_1424622 [Cyathus striatus]|nr:hypothetical protein BDQ17DRAFT_1424622 [Cyathus striatus]